MSYSVCAVICAAGKGLRAGFEKNKLLIPFQGTTALEKTLSAFDFPAIDEIVVTASETASLRSPISAAVGSSAAANADITERQTASFSLIAGKRSFISFTILFILPLLPEPDARES